MTLDKEIKKAIIENPIAMRILEEQYLSILTGPTPVVYHTHYPARAYKDPEYIEACELLVKAGLVERTYRPLPLRESELQQLAEILGVKKIYEARFKPIPTYTPTDT